MLFERQYILFDMGFSSLIQNENIYISFDPKWDYSDPSIASELIINYSNIANSPRSDNIPCCLMLISQSN